MQIAEFLKCGKYTCGNCTRWMKLPVKAHVSEVMGTCKKTGSRTVEDASCISWASEDGTVFKLCRINDTMELVEISNGRRE